MPDGIVHIVTVKIPKEFHFRAAVDTGMSVKNPSDQARAGAVTSPDGDWPGVAQQTYLLISGAAALSLLGSAGGEDWMGLVGRQSDTSAIPPAAGA